MTNHDLSHARWKKSSRSSGNGQCVEWANLNDAVALRDSKNPSGPVLVFGPDEWRAFIGIIQGGEANR